MSLTSPHDSTVTPMTSLTLPASSAPQPHTGISRREHVQHAANLLWFATALGLISSADAFAMRSPLPIEHLGLTLIMALLLVPGWLKLNSAVLLQRTTIMIAYAVVWWHYSGLMEATRSLMPVTALIASCTFAAPITSREMNVSKINIVSIFCLSLLSLAF